MTLVVNEALYFPAPFIVQGSLLEGDTLKTETFRAIHIDDFIRSFQNFSNMFGFQTATKLPSSSAPYLASSSNTLVRGTSLLSTIEAMIGLTVYMSMIAQVLMRADQ